MIDHLPECIYAPRNVDPDKGIEWGGLPCICAALRACEQRVRREDDDYAYVAAQAEADGRRHGWNEALDAALEAVAETQRWHEFSWGMDDDEDGEYVKTEEAFAAIDALRQERSGNHDTPPPAENPDN
jgi:predicted transcriptional regulator